MMHTSAGPKGGKKGKGRPGLHSLPSSFPLDPISSKLSILSNFSTLPYSYKINKKNIIKNLI